MSTTTRSRATREPATIRWEEADSPLGTFLLAGDGHLVVRVSLPGCWAKEDVPHDWVYAPGAMAPAREQLDGYFDGTRRAFDLEFAPRGTAFQRSVWKALEAIPYGETATYRDVATAVGNDRATRAVGLANNRNPIALLVPCHRVIGADGSLTGYGGGLEMKAWLLDHERRVLAGPAAPPTGS
jgi:methylated-DNA-[protein]-cysteine S-methyltransferase